MHDIATTTHRPAPDGLVEPGPEQFEAQRLRRDVGTAFARHVGGGADRSRRRIALQLLIDAVGDAAAHHEPAEDTPDVVMARSAAWVLRRLDRRDGRTLEALRRAAALLSP